MIRVKTYKHFFEHMAEAVQGISKVYTVADEQELEKFLRDLEDKEVVLVAVIPSSDTIFSDLDNKQEQDNAVVYILKKTSDSDMTEDDLLDLRDDTQIQITELKEQLHRMAMDTDSLDPHIEMARRLVPVFHTDPEYNYLGCNGWSISFKWKTNSYDNSL
jgi:hypothetical protein